MTAVTKPRLTSVGNNPTRIWGMTNAERLRRMAKAQAALRRGDRRRRDARQSRLCVRSVVAAASAARPGTVLTRAGVPVLAHVGREAERSGGERMKAAMLTASTTAAGGLDGLAR